MKLSRRKFLRAAGVSLALPWLDSLVPARAAESRPPLRMVCMCDPLGFNPQNFFPDKAGKDYQASTYLEVLQELRNDFTVMSGLSRARQALRAALTKELKPTNALTPMEEDEPVLT